jgi:hypothetical protein
MFGPNYLRGPNGVEIARISVQNAARGFYVMFRSINCMHWS